MSRADMLKKTTQKVICCLLALGVLGCSESSSNTNDAVTKTYPSPQLIEKERSIYMDESAESLCKRLHEIKKLPYRDPNDTDPIYEALIAKGREAMPCLIEKITDECPMPDPREAPPWQNYKVGDTAVFILVDIASNDEDFILKMLPPKYRQEWETNGVYAYFNYVFEPSNRRELQKWWRNWMKKNQGLSSK